MSQNRGKISQLPRRPDVSSLENLRSIGHKTNLLTNMFEMKIEHAPSSDLEEPESYSNTIDGHLYNVSFEPNI